ncbi:MAG TPA: pyrroloquinoline quinone biosynthesis protein PqqE [Roseburia sp.]|nr:pyrroloquinoline quinone biosynthesis protein PqqE [Roseburia sp.]
MENSRIEYQLEYAVWEMTHGCNMRCQHCGSSCAQPYLDEMTTKECLHVCDELINMGVKFVTLTGGEPTTKKDWYVIAEKLSKAGIYTNIISNGWFVEDDLVEKIKQAGIAICAISIDGVKETHDKIRKEGSFEKDLLALKKLKYHGVQTMVATTINNENIEELDEMYDIFSEIGVDFWQLQITLPMGNFLKQQTLFVEPGMIEQIKRDDLKGLCRECKYGDMCLGGCSNSRFTLNGTIESENILCSYNYKLVQARKYINKLDEEQLLQLFTILIEKNEYQIAKMVYDRIKNINGNQVIEMCEKYLQVNTDCKENNNE